MEAVQLIDTHCHAYASAFDVDREEAMARAAENGVGRLLLPNIDVASIGPLLDLVAAHPQRCYPMMGLHPCHVEEDWQEQCKTIVETLDAHPCVAVGEIGMDLFRGSETREFQLAAFHAQIGWALERDLPVVLHVREAFKDTFDVLDQYSDTALRGVFHCFTGGLEEAERVMGYGSFCFGLGGSPPSRTVGLTKSCLTCLWTGSSWRPTALIWLHHPTGESEMNPPTRPLWLNGCPTSWKSPVRGRSVDFFQRRAVVSPSLLSDGIMMTSRILLVYTGGTIGSFEDTETGALRPLDFEHLKKRIPEIDALEVELDFESLAPIDSSDMTPERWSELARLLFLRRDRFDGFVLLHGTDTMAYTASALSFMLPDFGKPVVLTGSQLPIGVLRTDGKENLLTAIEIAAKWDSMDPERGPLVREVVVYFGDELLRGNRSHKQDAEGFQALVSPNFPALAEVGVHVRFRRDLLLRPRGEARLIGECDRGVTVVHLTPCMTAEALAHQLAMPGLRAAILRTYGSGNAPRNPEFWRCFLKPKTGACFWSM